MEPVTVITPLQKVCSNDNSLPLDELSTYESENLANKESELDRLYSWANVLDTTRFSKNIFHSFGSTSEAQIFLECCTRRGQNYDRSSWIWCQTRASLGQISDDFADGLLCKDNKSNFLRSPNRISLAEVIRLLEGVRLRCYGFIPEAHRPLFVKTTNLLIGDGESGPQAGPPSMGREDDDDDDCVGFHRFSRLNRSSKMVEAGAQWHTRLNVCNLHKHSQCATIPKYGPPKRDPVAAAISGPVRQSIDASTLSTWRDVISRTCGEGADLYSTEAKVWQGSSRQGSSWQGGGIRTNCTNRSAGFFLRAH
jgi:hypothetical protein